MPRIASWPSSSASSAASRAGALQVAAPHGLAEPAQQRAGDRAREPRRALRVLRAARAQHEHVRGAGRERGVERDRLGQPRVQVAPALDLHRRPGEQRQRRGGAQRALERGAVAQRRAEVDGAAGLDVGGERVEAHALLQHALEVQRQHVLVEVLDEVARVDDGPPAQRVRAADVLADQRRVRVRAQAVGRVAAQQPDAVERARRRPVDRVEGVREPELVDRDRHPGRDGPAHPAALDRERQVRAVVTLAGRAPAEQLGDRVRGAHALSDSSAARRRAGISVGRRFARSTKTCTNQPSAASSSLPRSRRAIS